MERDLKVLTQWCDENDAIVNAKKFGIMPVGFRKNDMCTSHEFDINGTSIPVIDKFKCLGMIVAKNGSLRQWAKKLKQNAWGFANKHKSTPFSNKLSFRTKHTILRNCIPLLWRFADELLDAWSRRELQNVKNQMDGCITGLYNDTHCSNIQRRAANGTTTTKLTSKLGRAMTP